MNIGKTQLLSHNYSPPEENGRYPLAWQGDASLCQNATIFLQIKKKKLKDTARWSLIPFLIFSSRIESSKMNIDSD